MKRIAIGLVVLFWASLSLASDPATAYKKAAGPFEVGVADASLKDARRNTTLSIRIHSPRPSPALAGPLPMVIFSHGAGGSSDTFPDLCRHWASHGYVVVNPTHGDSIKQRRERGEVFDPAKGNLAQQVVGRVNLFERRGDVQLILDSIDQLEKETKLSIDRERIAMAGHSAGALTTQTLAGVKFFGPRGRGLGFAEPRLKAFILVSGQGLTMRAFREESWKDIKSPMLVIAGSEDRSPAREETPEGRRHPFEHASPGDKYLVYIEGATHGSYAGKDTVRVLGEKPPKNLGYITDVTAFSTLAFLDAYLKDDKAARAYLASDALARHPGGTTDYRHK
jgi:predicted dienelactone hydrolase